MLIRSFFAALILLVTVPLLHGESFASIRNPYTSPAAVAELNDEYDLNDIVCGFPDHDSEPTMKAEEFILPDMGVLSSAIKKCNRHNNQLVQVGTDHCCCVKAAFPISAELPDSPGFSKESVDIWHPVTMSRGFQPPMNIFRSLTLAPEPFPPRI